MKGPTLKEVILNKENITEKLRAFYGENNDWNQKLWTYKELFGNDCQGKEFKFSFQGKREYFMDGFVHNLDQYFHPIRFNLKE